MIRVVTPGIYSSLQDAGRFGYRSYGVPLSGPMDAIHAGLARDLVGGEHNQTILEFYQQGPVLEFKTQIRAAICGLGLNPKVNNLQVPTARMLTINKNQKLYLGSSGKGLYGYLAIQGGFKTQQVLGSSCYYKGITIKARLEKEDVLAIHDAPHVTVASAHIKKQELPSFKKAIQVYKGPEFELLSRDNKTTLLNNLFTLSANCNRMGYRFKANPTLGLPGILTGPVQPGTVQLTPSGELIVMMRDAQTTGGYARVLQVSPRAISELAQQRPGSKLGFSLI